MSLSMYKTPTKGRNAPLLRRVSATEAVLLEEDYEEEEEIESGEDEPEDAGALNSSVQMLKARFKQGVKKMSEEEQEAKRRTMAKNLVVGQRKTSATTKAKNISMNTDDFRKLKRNLKKSGMTTNGGMRQVLNPIIEDTSTEFSSSSSSIKQRQQHSSASLKSSSSSSTASVPDDGLDDELEAIEKAGASSSPGGFIRRLSGGGKS